MLMLKYSWLKMSVWEELAHPHLHYVSSLLVPLLLENFSSESPSGVSILSLSEEMYKMTHLPGI